jgi:hypothetical protein
VGDEHDGAGVVGEEVSSHSMASMSRWLVGSSSSSRSGCATSARASSTRRFHPPDSVSTMVSAGRSRRDKHQLDPLLEAPAVALLQLVLQLAQARQRGRAAVLGHSTAAW